MTQDPINLVQAIASELTALQGKRDALVSEVSEIDGKIAAIAAQLGLKASAPTPLARLAPRVVDKRHVGTVPEAMMQVLLDADRGYTRAELKQELRKGPMGDSIRKNENTYYNAVKRYLDNDKIVERGGYLYHPDRAPLPDGEADPSGRHLPSNVSNLFADREGG